jgi:hypothetical protein
MANHPTRLSFTDLATAYDQLDREDNAGALVDLIHAAETPFTVGLYGAWGKR